MRILSIDVGIKNLAMCILEDQKTITFWEVSQIPSEHKDGLFPVMKRHLDEKRDSWSTADIVLIERQPDRNRKMKSIENFIHTYFLCQEKRTLLWDAKHKVPDVIGPGKKKYKLRKDTSVERCYEWIKENAKDWVEFFEKHKKKDDLADTVMQALSFKERKETKKTVKPRKPTQNQMETKFTPANLAWLLNNNKHGETARFDKDLKRYYKDIEELRAVIV
jgi:hypothetical protein